MNKCPHYQGVCGLDESSLCYCSSNFEHCNTYKIENEGTGITDTSTLYGYDSSDGTGRKED